MKKTELSRSSPKRAKLIKEGLKTNGTFTIDVASIRARQGAMSSKVADTLFGKPKPAKASKKNAKKRAWDIFSKWIRLRDSDEHGRVKCITCSAVKHWKEMDAGHYITRAKESTLFDEQNVNGQCGGCNRWQGGKFLEHAQAIERKYGTGTRDRIETKAMQLCKRTLNDYGFIEKVYKERVALIQLNDPQKFGCAA